ncbi:MAG: CoB--CoM heterodisulfide reductase iron-sulfur subunit A family protein [Bacteroidetes bacterium]|nr:CoB--CoM heterodisulfide reductase iron-sulfur subunit A family protein [Bacteroidota bacterium]
MGDKIGICFYDSGQGFSDYFNFKELYDYASGLPQVTKIWNTTELDLKSPEKINEQIKEVNPDKMILAGDFPGEIKNLFVSAMSLAGKKAENIELASFVEHAYLNGQSTEMAKVVLLCAIKGVDIRKVLVPDEVDVHPDTLVIGGGIAGIQASLEIANGGQKVFLLEKTGTIGGHMAMFDKTFPTLDCAACILTPKMVDVGQHSNIELITYAELKSISGVPGDYKVTIHKKARKVNLATCIGCGICSEKCPRVAPSEFDAGIAMRKAIYIPFPQAVPNKYLVDEANCTYFENGKCKVCVKLCPVPDCIDLDEKDTDVEITVGNIIVASGFKPFDAKRIERFGYGKFPNVLTSLEFERLINASGPTGGNITFRSQDKKGNWIFKDGSGTPSKIAVIHCIGSRDENYNKYCSKVCCMYSLKLAHLIKEKIPEADVFEYFIDMRAFGKGYEEFYERIKQENVHMIRGRTASIKEKDQKLELRSEDILNEKIIEQEVDMVVLAIGLEAAENSNELANMLGIPSSKEGWYNEVNYNSNPVNTSTGGISIAGLCQGPKDIPDTVAQASAAAARVLQSIIKGKIQKSIKDIKLTDVETSINQLMKK